MKKIVRCRRNNICAPKINQKLLKASDPDSIFTNFTIADNDFLYDAIYNEKYQIELKIKELIETNDIEKINMLNDVKKSILTEKIVDDDSEFVLSDTYKDKIVTFYQSSDGRLIFLDQMNMNMIKDQFGEDPSKWPEVLEGEIFSQRHEVIETVSSNEILQHLPPGAELFFVLIDITQILSPDIFNQYRKRIEVKRRIFESKNKPPKEKKHVITKKDYQKFVPIEREIVLKEDDFPPLSNQTTPKFKKLAPSTKPKEDFPSFHSNASTHMKDKKWVLPLQDDKPKQYKEEFPNIDNIPKPPQRPKKPSSAWGNLKI